MREKIKGLKVTEAVETTIADVSNPLHTQSNTGSNRDPDPDLDPDPDPGNAKTGGGTVEMVDYHDEGGLSAAPGLKTEDQGSTIVDVDVDVEERTDPATGNTYYYSPATGETSWDRPEVTAASGPAGHVSEAGAAPLDVQGEVFIHIPNNNPAEVMGLGLAGGTQSDVI